MEKIELGFICKTKSKLPLEGKLEIPIPFLFEYGSSLPQELYLELPTGAVWFGKYVKDSPYIEGLEKLFEFYVVKPYHMFVFHYCGGPYLKIKIFNECGVEISYPLSCQSSCKLRPRRNDPFVVLKNTINLTEFEIDKMAATCTFNTVHNFRGLHEIVIPKNHLMLKPKYEVLVYPAFENLGLDEGINTIDLCFKHYCWTIKVKWENGVLYFFHGWYVFLKAAKICEGDICVFERTGDPTKFRIAVIPKLLFTQWSSTSGETIGQQGFSCYKKLKASFLESGKLEMPRLFAMRIGRELGRKVNFVAGDGRKFRGEYSVSRNRISGLKEMIRAYDIYDNCVIVFYYVGCSTFNVSIFDSLNVDHLKDINGEFIADILRSIEMEEIANGSENVAETEVGDGHISIPVEDDVVSVNEVSYELELPGNESDAEQGNYMNHPPNLEVEMNNRFVVELKLSHFQEKGRGAYCSTSCYEFYRKWNASTIISLDFEGQRFELGVQRSNRSCRFGRGWDEFVRKTGLQQGQVLDCRFILPKTMEVFRMN